MNGPGRQMNGGGSDVIMRTARLGETEIIQTKQAMVELADLAMKFSRIERTCVAHPDGKPETDGDHTVMISWLAPALAEMINLKLGYDKYPVGKVAQYCVVHDASEVYAGDTPTHKITPEEYAAKEAREGVATERLHQQFVKRLPWFARLVREYESQRDPVARFVRSVDKIMPKLVHVINAAEDLVRVGMTREDFIKLYNRQRQQIEDWCPEPVLLQLYDELCGEVARQYVVAAKPPERPASHFMIVENGRPRLLGHVVDCLTACKAQEVFDRWVEWNTLPLNDGEYPVGVTEDGLLQFVGVQEN